jgi:hypothetical protein
MARDDPGSKSGQNKGCLCSPEANNKGKGIKTLAGDYVFMIEPGCPLHGLAIHFTDDDDEEMMLDKYLLPRV